MQVQVGFSREKILSIISQQQYLEALDRYRDYLKSQPDHLATVLIDLYRLLIDDYKNLNIRLIICELCIQFKQYQDAFNELEEMVEIDAHFSQSYFLLAKIYNKTHDYGEIQAIFEAAFDKGIRDSIILDLLPKIYLDQNQVHEAKDFFETLVQEPDVPSHYYKVLAELYKKLGDFERCVAIYDELIQKEPQYTQDAYTICESILDDYPTFTAVRKKVVLFYIKDCKPDRAIEHLELCLLFDTLPVEEVLKQYQDLLAIFPSHKESICSYIEYLVQHELLTDACDKIELLRPDFSSCLDYVKALVLTMKTVDERHSAVTLLLIDVLIEEKHYLDALLTVLDLLSIETHEDLLKDLESRCLDIQAKNISQKQLLALCLASIYYHQDRFELAHAHCDRSSPDMFELVELKLKLLMKEKRFPEAKSYVSTQFKKFPTQGLLYILAHELYRQSISDTLTEKSASEQIVSSLMESDPIKTVQIAQKVQSNEADYVLSQLTLIRAFYSLNKFEQALQISEHIVSYVKESHHELSCQALFLKSLCHYQMFEFKKASDCLDDIDTIDINFSFSKAMKSHLEHIPFSAYRGYAMTAAISPWSGKLSLAAIQNLDEKLSLGKKQNAMSFGVNHNNQGVDFMMKENWLSAESEFNVSLQLDPSLDISFSNLALLKLMQDDYEQAEFYIKRAEEQNADLDAVCLNKGLLAYKQGHFESALEAFQRALKLNPYNAYASFNIAMIHFESGRLDIAFEYFKKISHLGLFFIPLQALFYFLDTSHQDLLYWNKPSQGYGFESPY